jgi:CelD/BcsL family acetyltransferase involved in cellulose biosynthesis
LKVAAPTFEEFLDARTKWNFALQRSLDNHIFLTWEWLSCWWKHYGNKRNFILVTINDGEKILAAAPLMNTEYNLFGMKLRKIEFIGTPASDYHSFLLTVKKPEYTRTMIKYVNRIAPDWDCFEFEEVPTDSETADVLRTISKEPFKLKEDIGTLCPYIILPSKFEDYFKGLGSNWRRNMRRWVKKLKQDFKVEFKICNSVETIDDALRTFFDLHQKRWRSKRQPGEFADKTFCDFHHDVARSFAEKGWLTLCFLTLDDEPVSAVYAFKYAQKMFNYLTGFDPQYSIYRVGHLIFLYLIQHSMNNGTKEFDFMRGDESYKRQWNPVVRKNLELRAIRKRFVPIVYNWIMHARARAIMKNDRFSSSMRKIGRPIFGKVLSTNT